MMLRWSWSTSRGRAAGWEGRGLRGIGERGERSIRIGIAITNRVRQPAALTRGRHRRGGHRSLDRREAARVFPTQTGAEQLVLPLVVDLGDELRLRELRA